MFALSVDPGEGLLTARLSGRLTTQQALTAVAQASAVLEASRLQRVLCDVRDVTRSPGDLGLIAAAIAVRSSPLLRVAFVTHPAQAPLVRRLSRFSGRPAALQLFGDAGDALTWLAEPAPRARPFATEQRHAEHLAALSRPTRPVRVTVSTHTGPAA